MMKGFSLIACLLVSLFARAEDLPEMADALRQDGKFWIVVICLLIILFGIFAWLFLLDRKIAKLEKEQSQK